MQRLVELLSERRILWLCGLSAVTRLVFLAIVEPEIVTAEDYNIAQHLVRGEGFAIYTRGPTTAKGLFIPVF